MADYVNTNTIQTRISLKYDSYANWTSKNPKLLKGELAIATVPADTKKPDGSTNLFENLPNVVMKVGDGTNNYNDLPFVSGLAADVYAWAKAATKPSYSISEIAGAQEYRIVPMAGEGNENKYALQSRKAGSENAWSNVADSVIDLSQIVADIADHESRIGTIESDLNTATTGLKARMDAVENDIKGLTGNSGGIQGAINTTIQTLDANVSQEAGADGLALNIVEVDGVITSISGSIKAETYDAYGSAAAVKKELTEGAIKANADAIDVIEGSDAGKSMREVATAVATSAVENLDKTVNQEAGADGLALEVVQENGLLKSVSGSIKANTYDAYGAAAAVQGDTTHTVAEAYALADAAQTAEEVAAAVKVEEDARKAAIQALDYTGYEAGSAEGTTISFVGTISETDGVVAATKRDLVFTDAYSASNPAATKKYVDDAVKTGVADLNGAMHFEGVYEEMPSVNHNGEAFVAGDVIIVGKTEYVYSNGAFVELGDEGAIAAALGALTLDEIGGEAKTLVISQSNGKVSAEAKDIKIE